MNIETTVRAFMREARNFDRYHKLCKIGVDGSIGWNRSSGFRLLLLFDCCCCCFGRSRFLLLVARLLASLVLLGRSSIPKMSN